MYWRSMDPWQTVLPTLVLFAGILVGFLLGYFLGKKVHSQSDPHQMDTIRKELAGTREDLAASNARQTALDKDNADLILELNKKESELRQKIGSESAARTHLQDLHERMGEQKKEMQSMLKNNEANFETMAHRILKNNADDFQKQSRINLEGLLKPLQSNLETFSTKIDVNRKDQIAETASLKQQIEQLTNLNQQMSTEARNLTRALKGDSKTRGNWGEMVLEHILDRSGLVKNAQYRVQKTLQGDDGPGRPDVIIDLPEDKHLIIDSKVSLVHYEEFSSAESEEDSTQFLKLHIESMKQHIKDLSSKNYTNLYSIHSPDFVMMFIPIEPAFNAALQFDIDIYNNALANNIVLVTPSTLIATLKIIYNIWRQEKQNQNALDIATTGGKLYDKLHGFVTDLEGIGKSLVKAQDSYQSAFNKLSQGRGNALGIAEKMKELGAKTMKQID